MPNEKKLQSWPVHCLGHYTPPPKDEGSCCPIP